MTLLPGLWAEIADVHRHTRTAGAAAPKKGYGTGRFIPARMSIVSDVEHPSMDFARDAVAYGQSSCPRAVLNLPPADTRGVESGDDGLESFDKRCRGFIGPGKR